MCARFPCCSPPLLLLTVWSEQLEADRFTNYNQGEHCNKVNDPHSDIISLIWRAKAIENPSFFVRVHTCAGCSTHFLVLCSVNWSYTLEDLGATGVISSNTLLGRCALKRAALIVTHTDTHTRSVTLECALAWSLQIPGDCVSFAGASRSRYQYAGDLQDVQESWVVCFYPPPTSVVYEGRGQVVLWSLHRSQKRSYMVN